MDERAASVTPATGERSSGKPHPKTRAAVTNGSRLWLTPASSDRRQADLIEEFSRPHGGMTALSEEYKQIVRRLAALSVWLELQEAEQVAGKIIDAVAFCTSINVQRRLMRELGKLKPRTTRESAAAARRAFLEQRFGSPAHVSDAA